MLHKKIKKVLVAKLNFLYIFTALLFYDLSVFILFFLLTLNPPGTESEVSFSLLGPGKRRQSQIPSPLNISSGSSRLLIGPIGPAIKIAAINGKPRVQRYLSKECEFYFVIIILVNLISTKKITKHMETGLGYRKWHVI